MKTKQITDVNQLDFSFENQGFGAVAIAAKKIADGEIVSFDVFDRKNKANSKEVTYINTFYFGIFDLGKPDGFAFRVSENQNLDIIGSHSIIPSWYGNIVKDPVFIAARLQLYLMGEGSDFFINTFLQDL